MKIRRTVCRALCDGVGVVVSTLLTCIVGAVVNPMAGAALFVSGLVTMGVLLSGCGESRAVRLLAQARTPLDYELAALRPAIAVLEELDLTSPPIYLLVRGGPSRLEVVARGRRTVVISADLVEAIAGRWIRADEGAALLAHAIGRLRLGQTRYDVALRFWVLPWQLLRAVGAGVGRALGRYPLIAFAWHARFIVGTVAVVQGFTGGRSMPAAIEGAVIVLSYVVPWADRQADLASENDVDRFVAQAGLGDALCRLLERGRRTPRILQRIHRIRSVSPPAPAGWPGVSAS